MSPWEELEYWDFPLVTPVVCPPGITTVATKQVRRTVLIISNPTSIPLTAGPNDAPVGLSSGVGYGLSNTTPPLMMITKDYGPLAQQTWCVNNPTATTVTIQVIECLLKEWPSSASTRMGAAGPRAPQRLNGNPDRST